MENHVMYFYDKDGELCLTRCCFCLWMKLGQEGKMTCLHGCSCGREECGLYAGVGRESMPRRIAELKRCRKENN